jgi:transposase
MSKIHFIAMDTHGTTTDACVKTKVSDPPQQWHGPTTISALRSFIETVPRPRHLTFEEGPLADWLLRGLVEHVDKLVVNHARRNAHIAKEGDKDDPIDAGKLCDLFCGGYLKAVHHPDSVERVLFKQLVGLYHERVAHRVSEGNKIIGQFKRWGLIVSEAQVSNHHHRPELLSRLPAHELVRQNLELLTDGYDEAAAQVKRLKSRLIKRAKEEEFIVRLQALPGIGWIRASTFFVYIDTPWRFPSKSHLWRYMGIGLHRERSGNGKEFLCVDLACNRHLKSMILGAANTIICNQSKEDNPFAGQYRQWVSQGLSPRNARRNLARSLAATGWGMWKSGSVYHPEWVGVKARDIP